MTDEEKKKLEEQKRAEVQTETANDGNEYVEANGSENPQDFADYIKQQGSGSGLQTAANNEPSYTAPTAHPNARPETQNAGAPDRSGLNAKTSSMEGAASETPAAGSGYDDVYSKLIEDRQAQYQKDAAALERRRRSQDMIGSITDAARAVANMHYTTKGAPNAFDPTKGMSEASRARYERAKAQLDAANARDMSYLQQLHNARIAKDNYDLAKERHDLNKSREERIAANQAAAQEYKKETLALKQKAQSAKEAFDAGRLTIQQYNAETARIRANARNLDGRNGSNMAEYEIEYIFDDWGRKMGERRTLIRDNQKYKPTEKTDLGNKAPRGEKGSVGNVGSDSNSNNGKKATPYS